MVGGEDRIVDCNAAFTAATPLDGKASGPSIADVTFTVSAQTANPSSSYVDPDYCNTVELRAVVRDAASSQASFAGVGFWTSRGKNPWRRATCRTSGT